MTVLELYIAPVMHKPMQRVDRVTAITQRGLDGDHRCRAKLVLSRRATAMLGRDTPQRQVSFLDIDALEKGNAAFLASGVSGARALTTMEMRRNIVTQGVDLNSLVGQEFTVGSVHFRGTVLATPCSIPLWARATDEAPYRQDHYDTFIPAFWPNGGLCAEVLSGGVIDVGAVVQRLTDTPSGLGVG